jgi:hypothetical protein
VDKLEKITSRWITSPPNIFACDLAKPPVNFSKTAPDPKKILRGSLEGHGRRAHGQDPSNAEFEVSLFKGYGANETMTMEIAGAPSVEDW